MMRVEVKAVRPDALPQARSAPAMWLCGSRSAQIDHNETQTLALAEARGAGELLSGWRLRAVT